MGGGGEMWHCLIGICFNHNQKVWHGHIGIYSDYSTRIAKLILRLLVLRLLVLSWSPGNSQEELVNVVVEIYQKTFKDDDQSVDEKVTTWEIPSEFIWLQLVWGFQG